MAQTHDIEDVVSSIRRLVANDIKPAVEAALAPADEPQAPALVLAPTQRVTDPEDPFQMIRTMAQAERDARDAKHLVDVVDAEVEAMTSDVIEREFGAALDWSRPNAPTETDWANGYEEDADYQPDAANTVEGEMQTSAPATSIADDPAKPASTEESVPEVPSITPTATFSDDDDDDGQEIDLSDVVGAVSTDDALRDLIAEIVRQELSGALGERITRNVRKLVRREIRQMLSSGEFD